MFPVEIEAAAQNPFHSRSVGRWIALEAGLPIEVPGMQLDRRCGGGLQAVITAAMMVQSGAADVVLAGGVESMSNVEYYTTDMRWGTRSGARCNRGAARDGHDARRDRRRPRGSGARPHHRVPPSPAALA